MKERAGLRGRAAVSGLAFGLCLVVILGVLLPACGSHGSSGTAKETAATSMAGTNSTSAAGAGGGPGAPPARQGGGSGAPGGDTSTAVYPTKAAYTQSGGTKTVKYQTYTESVDDQSGILVSNGGSLTVIDSKVQTTGDTSSSDSSSFYGLNAAVVATSGSSITLSGGSITTTGSGANGAFATGENSSVGLTDVTIEAAGGGGHGVMATQGGSVSLTNVNITTVGANSAPLATDRGGGAITAAGGGALASGKDSPALYSTGTITVSDGTYKATGAEAAVIEGGNSIALTNVNLSSSVANKWGVMIYQSMSGDATGAKGTFSMRDGSLTLSGANGPLFYVTNSTGIIDLRGVQLSSASGVLVKAAAGNWGTAGANGGTAVLTATHQKLKGDLVADSLSSLTIDLTDSSVLNGAINADKNAEKASLILDSTSTWKVTADCYLTTLTLTGGVSGSTIDNIVGNGHTVYYDPNNAANSPLGGKTYSLAGGGTLKPLS